MEWDFVDAGFYFGFGSIVGYFFEVLKSGEYLCLIMFHSLVILCVYCIKYLGNMSVKGFRVSCICLPNIYIRITFIFKGNIRSLEFLIILAVKNF